MCVQNQLSGGSGCRAGIAMLIGIGLLIGGSGVVLAQTSLGPRELVGLKELCTTSHADILPDTMLQEPITMELRATPKGVVALEDRSDLRDSVDLYRGLQSANNGFWSWSRANRVAPYPARDVARMGSAVESGGHVTEYEFAFGLHARTDSTVLRPYIVVNFHNVSSDSVTVAGRGVNQQVVPVSSIAYRFDPIELPAAGSYAVRSGLIDLAASGLDFALAETFTIEILPLEWSDAGPVFNPDVFAVFTSPETVTYGANLERPAESGQGDVAPFSIQTGIILRGRADPVNVLALDVDEQGCAQPGKTITVRLSQRNLLQMVDSYEAYLKFDPSRLEFVHGVYEPNSPYDCLNPDCTDMSCVDPNCSHPSCADPNCIHPQCVYPGCSAIKPWGLDPNDPKYIDLCASTCNPNGINNDADLVTLNFLAGTTEGPTWLWFRGEDIPGDWPALFWGHNPPIPYFATIETAVYLYIDGTPPDANCPPDVTVQCFVDTPPVAQTPAEFRDQDGWMYDLGESFRPLTVEHEGDVVVQNGSGCPDPNDHYIFERTYRIIDCAGNSSTCTQTITVYDYTAPNITCPADIGPEDTDPNQCTATVDWPDATATDNCTDPNDLVITYWVQSNPNSDPSDPNNYDVPISNPDTFNVGTTNVMAKVEDECGNLGTCSEPFEVSVQDGIPPDITCPPPDVVQCPEDAGVPADDCASWFKQGGTASDNCTACEDLTFTWLGDESNGNTCPELITRTYKVIDESGNSTVCMQPITVDDTIPPEITCPLPDVVQCPGDVTVPADDCASWLTQGGTASDNCTACEDLTFTWLGDESDGNTCPELITRWYKVMDECGNSTVCAQPITIDDDILPECTCPADITICPGDPIPAPNCGEVTCADNCPGVTCEWVGDESDGGTCPETITRTYRCTDACGNTCECTQKITIDDTIDPNITCPDDITIECDESTDPNITGRPICQDNCGLDPNSPWYEDEPDPNDLPGCCGTGSFIRTWTCMDVCGNKKTCEQTITLEDKTPPEIVCPDNVTVCPGEVPAPATDCAEFRGQGGTTSDNCCDPNELTCTWLEDESDGNTCPELITRRYKVLDECGNSTVCTQPITVDDDIPPTITQQPSDQTVECDGTGIANQIAPWLANHGGALASDICSDPNEITWDDDFDPNNFDLDPNCNGAGYVDVKFTALDACANGTDTSTARFTIEDTTPPVVTCPPDITYGCGWHVPVCPETYQEFVNLGGTTSDNCTDPNDLIVRCMDPNEHPGDGFLRTYKITDQCGNSVICTQDIVIIDEPPDVTCPPEISVEVNFGPCQAQVWFEATATDVPPDPPPTIKYYLGYECGDPNQEITSPWYFPTGWSTVCAEATDDCNSTDQCRFKVWVTEDFPPWIDECPEDFTVVPGAGQSIPLPVFWVEPLPQDNCPGAHFSYQSHHPGDAFYEGETEVTYIARDASRNLSEPCTFTITVLPQSDLDVTVELWPTTAVGWPSELKRCISFELWDCSAPGPVEVEQQLTFREHPNYAGLVAGWDDGGNWIPGVTIQVPPGEYTCITAQDKLHTLRRTDENFHIQGDHFVADFTGDPFHGGDALIGGDIETDFQFDGQPKEYQVVDIGDFTIWIHEYDRRIYTGGPGDVLMPYDSDVDGTPDGDTLCDWCPPLYWRTGYQPPPDGVCWHADINGDTFVEEEDEVFIGMNFLEEDETNCCDRQGRPERTARTEMSVDELYMLGLEHLVDADRDGDGWVNIQDLASFMETIGMKRKQGGVEIDESLLQDVDLRD